MDQTEHPIATDSLTKGDFISASKLEECTGLPRTDRNFRLGIMRVQGYIEMKLCERGEIVTIKQEGDGLRILTDAEATEYNYRQGVEIPIRKMRRNIYRQSGVDVRNLSDQDKVLHERRITIASKVYQAAGVAKRTAIKLMPHSRSTPKIAGAQDTKGKEE